MIVGSAIVRLIEQHMEDPDLPAVVAEFVKQLKRAVTGGPAGRTGGRARRFSKPIAAHS